MAQAGVRIAISIEDRWCFHHFLGFLLGGGGFDCQTSKLIGVWSVRFFRMLLISELFGCRVHTCFAIQYCPLFAWCWHLTATLGDLLQSFSITPTISVREALLLEISAKAYDDVNSVSQGPISFISVSLMELLWIFTDENESRTCPSYFVSLCIELFVKW